MDNRTTYAVLIGGLVIAVMLAENQQLSDRGPKIYEQSVYIESIDDTIDITVYREFDSVYFTVDSDKYAAWDTVSGTIVYDESPRRYSYLGAYIEIDDNPAEYEEEWEQAFDEIEQAVVQLAFENKLLK